MNTKVITYPEIANNSSDSAVKIFENDEFGSIEYMFDSDGSPWFWAKGVAVILGYKDASDAVKRHCKSGKKVFRPHANGVGGIYSVFINESDLYRLIMRSNLPNVSKFQDWVYEDVLPSIRKNGSYSFKQKPKSFEERSISEHAIALVDYVSGISSLFNWDDSSKAKILNRGAERLGLPMIDYVDSNGLRLSLTDLKNRRGIQLSTIKLNQLLEEKGVISTQTRIGKSGKEKRFKMLTEFGLKFGENVVSPNNDREVQPLYFENKFDELLSLIGIIPCVTRRTLSLCHV